jgi:LuxR family maltose regulon positive regulatory protein
MVTTKQRAPLERPAGTVVHLTPTETAVLALLPTHLTLAAIGDRLGIGRPTVKTHIQHIYRKLGATNRAEAVESAESADLLPGGRSGPTRANRALNKEARR